MLDIFTSIFIFFYTDSQLSLLSLWVHICVESIYRLFDVFLWTFEKVVLNEEQSI